MKPGLKYLLIGIIYTLTWTSLNAQFKGGIGAGYATDEFNDPSSISLGGIKDGYDSGSYEINFSISKGAAKDGYHSGNYESNNSICNGGQDDGYVAVDHFSCFVWTGTIGTGWNIPGNWNHNAVPTFRSKVIIPEGPPFYPYVNAGLISVGKVTDTSIFHCNSIHIDSEAELYLRINAFMENYNQITIEGAMIVLNLDPSAVINKHGANILVKSGGELRFISP